MNTENKDELSFERLWLFLMLEDFKGRIVSLLVQLHHTQQMLDYLMTVTSDKRYAEIKDNVIKKILNTLGEDKITMKKGTLRWLLNSWVNGAGSSFSDDILWKFVLEDDPLKGVDISQEAIYELVMSMNSWDRRINAMIEGMGEVQAWIIRELESVPPGYRVIWLLPRRASRKLIIAISRFLRGYYIMGLQAFWEFSEEGYGNVEYKKSPPEGMRNFWNLIKSIGSIVGKAYHMFSRKHPEAIAHQEVAELLIQYLKHIFFVENSKLWIKYYNMFWDRWIWCSGEKWITLKRENMGKCNWCMRNYNSFNRGESWPVYKINHKSPHDSRIKEYFLGFMEIPSIVWKDIITHELIPNIISKNNVRKLMKEEWEEAERFRTYYSSLLTELYASGIDFSNVLDEMLKEVGEKVYGHRNDPPSFPISIFVSEFVTGSELTPIPVGRELSDEELRNIRFYTLKTPYWFMDIPRHVPVFAHEIAHVIFDEEIKLGRIKFNRTQTISSNLERLKLLFYSMIVRVLSNVMEDFEGEEIAAHAGTIASHIIADLFGLLIGGPAYLFTHFITLYPYMARLKDREFDQGANFIRIAFLADVMLNLLETRYDMSKLEEKESQQRVYIEKESNKFAETESGGSVQFVFLDVPWTMNVQGRNGHDEFTFEGIAAELVKEFLRGNATGSYKDDGLIFTVFGEYDMLIMRPHRSRNITPELEKLLRFSQGKNLPFSAYHIIYDVYGGKKKWEELVSESNKVSRNKRGIFWALSMVKLRNNIGNDDMGKLIEILKRYERKGLVKLLLRSTGWDEMGAFSYLGCGKEINERIQILRDMTSEIFEKGIAEITLTRILKQHYPVSRPKRSKKGFKLKVVNGAKDELIAITYLSFEQKNEWNKLSISELRKKIVEKIQYIANDFPMESANEIDFSFSVSPHIYHKIGLTWGLADAVILWTSSSYKNVDYCSLLTLIEKVLTELAREGLVSDSVTTLTFD